jgi:heterodisulfide reductase subunit A-like polyferredoxin
MRIDSSCAYQMNRAEMYRRQRSHAGAWDMIVVGGGATGAAIDAAWRGYDVLLLEFIVGGDCMASSANGLEQRALDPMMTMKEEREREYRQSGA